MSPGAIHYLLRAPPYRGVTRHKDKLYPDTHPAVVDEELWSAVQAKLDAVADKQPAEKLRSAGAPLAGLVFDDRDNPMVPLHSKKGVKRYRYHLSRPKLIGRGTAGSLHRISAGMLEGFVADHLAPRLAAGWLPDQPPVDRCVAALKRLVLGVDRLDAHVLTAALPPGADAEEGEDASLIRLAFDMRRERGAVILQAPGSSPQAKPQVDRALVRAVVLARKWSRELEIGQGASIKALAHRNSSATTTLRGCCRWRIWHPT